MFVLERRLKGWPWAQSRALRLLLGCSKIWFKPGPPWAFTLRLGKLSPNPAVALLGMWICHRPLGISRSRTFALAPEGSWGLCRSWACLQACDLMWDEEYILECSLGLWDSYCWVVSTLSMLVSHWKIRVSEFLLCLNQAKWEPAKPQENWTQMEYTLPERAFTWDQLHGTRM